MKDLESVCRNEPHFFAGKTMGREGLACAARGIYEAFHMRHTVQVKETHLCCIIDA